MTTTELAAVVVAGASVVGVLVLALFLARLNRTVREVGDSVQRLRFESVPIEASAGAGRGEALPSGRAAMPAPSWPRSPGPIPCSTSRTPSSRSSPSPSGTTRAATRFRRTRQER